MTASTQRERWYRLAGWLLVIYGGIEGLDTLAVAAAGLGWLPEVFPAWALQADPIRGLMANSPLWFLPLFFFVTFFRLLAGIGLLKNREWGFWAAGFISILTVIWMPFFLPISALDGLLLIPIITGLLLGRFGSAPLQQR